MGNVCSRRPTPVKPFFFFALNLQCHIQKWNWISIDFDRINDVTGVLVNAVDAIAEIMCSIASYDENGENERNECIEYVFKHYRSNEVHNIELN